MHGAARVDLGAHDGCGMSPEIRQHRQSGVPLVPRRAPQPVVERGKPQQVQVRPDRMAHIALRLGHREGDDRPHTVPRSGVRRAEGNDALQRLLDERRGTGAEAVVRVPPALGGDEQAPFGEAVQSRPGTRCADVELGEKLDQCRGRQVFAAAKPVMTEQRHEQVLRRGPDLRSGQASVAARDVVVDQLVAPSPLRCRGRHAITLSSGRRSQALTRHMTDLVAVVVHCASFCGSLDS